MKTLSFMLVALIFALGGARSTQAQAFCSPATISLDQPEARGHKVQRAALISERERILRELELFNRNCAIVDKSSPQNLVCATRQGPLQARVNEYVGRCRQFNKEVEPIASGDHVQTGSISGVRHAECAGRQT